MLIWLSGIGDGNFQRSFYQYGYFVNMTIGQGTSRLVVFALIGDHSFLRGFLDGQGLGRNQPGLQTSDFRPIYKWIIEICDSRCC